MKKEATVKGLKTEEVKNKLEELKNWYESAKQNEIKEKAIEAQIFINIFRDLLKWGKHVTGVESGGVRTDLRLLTTITKSDKEERTIPLEIKTPGINKAGWTIGEKQVVGYCIELKSKYGILTNGDRWEFIEVDLNKDFGRIIGIWYLFSANLTQKDNKEFLESLIRRNNTILELFHLFSKTFGKIGFAEIMERSLSRESIQSIIGIKDSVEISSKEEEFINKILKMIALNNNISIPKADMIYPKIKTS